MHKKIVTKTALRKNSKETVATPKIRNWQSYFGEALLIAVATSSSYALAFIYELGYCVHMGIPAHLITITPTNIIIAFSLTIGLLFALGWSVNFFDALIPFDNHKDLRLRLIIIGILSLCVGILFRFEGLSKWFLLFVSFSLLLTSPSAEKMINKISADSEIYLNDSTVNARKGFIEKTLGSKNTGYLVIAFLMAFITYMLGSAYAGGQLEFLVLKENPKMVMVRSYGDTLIFVEVNEEKKRIGNNVLIRKMPVDSTPLSFIAVRAGPFEKIFYECTEIYKKRSGNYCR